MNIYGENHRLTLSLMFKPRSLSLWGLDYALVETDQQDFSFQPIDMISQGHPKCHAFLWR